MKNNIDFSQRNKESKPFKNKKFGSLPFSQAKEFPSVTIVMPVGGTNNVLLEETIRALFHYTAYPNWKMVFIDNKSTKEMRAVMETVPNAKIITNKVQRSFAANCNSGIRATKADYYLLFSSDVLVREKYWLHKMVALAKSNEKIGVVGGGINSCGSFWWINDRGIAEPQHYYHAKFPRRFPIETQVVQGFNLLIKKSTYNKLKGFDEGFSPAFAEEGDFCIRARLNGFKVYDTYIRVFHASLGGYRDSHKEKREQLLHAGNRRLALKWKHILPSKPSPTYKMALSHLNKLTEYYSQLKEKDYELPATTDSKGNIFPLFHPLPTTKKSRFVSVLYTFSNPFKFFLRCLFYLKIKQEEKGVKALLKARGMET